MAGFRLPRKMEPVRQQVQLTQETLVDFLSSTRLAWLSGFTTWVRWLALALGVLAAAFGGLALALWWPDGFWSARLPASGALPALAAFPGCVLAWFFGQQRRLQAALIALFASGLATSILASWLRGPFSVIWYLQPFLALAAAADL